MKLLPSLLVALAFTLSPAIAQDAPKRPNFLIIVADDLGYSDVGAFGGEIDTPNLDALAARGRKLSNFHTSPMCSPTRAMLLTGLDNHETGLGAMAEVMAPNQAGKSGYEGFLRPDAATLAELLAPGGYRTHFSGKWHLGIKPEQAPHSRGFQSSFALLEGSSNHFGKDLSGHGIRANSPTYLADGQPVTHLPDDFYSSDYFATKLIDQLKAAKTGADASKPFFAYLAFTAPHWPVMAPPEVIAKYKGRYDAGYEALREQRLRRQVELGQIDSQTVPHDFYLAPRWDGLSAEEKALSSRRMEVFAAMVDRLDWNVGRVIEALRDSGELENTVILFLSDNGAEGTVLADARGKFQGGNDSADNSLDNMGTATSFDSIGAGWAEAATAPGWLIKGYQTEGGTRAPSFIAGPGITPGANAGFVSVMDVVPTFLEMAQVETPTGTLAGRKMRPIRGRSWTPLLEGKADAVYTADTPIGAELFGGRALRRGPWKLLDKGDGQWRLFNVVDDPGETRDLSPAEPERKAAMLQAWNDYAREVGVVMPSVPVPVINRPKGR